MRHHRYCIPSFLCLISSLTVLRAQECVEKARVEEQVLLRVVYHCRGNGTQTNLLFEGKRLLGKMTGRHKIKEVILGTDTRTLQTSIFSRVLANHGEGAGLDSLRNQVSALRGAYDAQFGPLARLIQMGSSIFATYSSAGTNAHSGRPAVSDVLIEGDRDPRFFRTGAGVLKLLWVEERSGTILPFHRLTLFFRSSGDLSCQSCRDALSFFRQEAGRKSIPVDIRVRKDTWFDGTEFPLLFRFEAEDPKTALGTLRLPTVEQYYRGTKEIFCSSRQELAPCALYGAWTAHEATKAIGKIK